MDTYFPVQVRYPGEELDIREFVQPSSYAVKKAVAQLYNPAASPEDNVKAMWDFVCREIAYPPLNSDYHREVAYPAGGLFGRFAVDKRTIGDFWELPFETLAQRVGDCEDTSALLGSMLRTFLSPNDVFVSIGYYGQPNPALGHAWVTVNLGGQELALETTLRRATSLDVAEAPPYLAYHRFNDQVHQELKPGFTLGSPDRRAKYCLICDQYGGLVKKA